MSILLALAVFIVGGVAGAAALRAWQQVKIFVAKPRMTLIEARYEMLKLAPRKPSIVMLGDSITAGVPWTEVAECAGVANYGFNGDTSAGALYRIQEILILQPRAVFLMVGANDILTRTKPSETADTIRRIVEHLEGAGIAVIVHPVLPIEGIDKQVEDTNRAVARELASTKAKIVPLAIGIPDLRDGIHMGPSGFVKWSDTIRPLMVEYCVPRNS
ncbi:MAG: GDSL-type esterase/lipase family protein [Hyphomicrobiaceae bacterium]